MSSRNSLVLMLRRSPKATVSKHRKSAIHYCVIISSFETLASLAPQDEGGAWAVPLS